MHTLRVQESGRKLAGRCVLAYRIVSRRNKVHIACCRNMLLLFSVCYILVHARRYVHFSNLLLVRGHDDVRLGANSVIRLPEAGDSLLLSVELHTGLAVESVGSATGDGLLVAGEGEHGKGDGNRDVDSNLTGLDLLLEASRGCAGACEDGGAVAVFVCVDEGDGVVEGGDVEADEDGTEDFLLVAGHLGGHVCDDSGADLRRICK